MDRLTVTEAVRILGLEGPVEAAAIKRAYRELARRHHPDRGGDPRVFQQVQEAYDLLRQRQPTARTARAAPAPEPTASVADRWWESPTRWHDAPVDTTVVDWDVPLPPDGPFALSRDRLARLLCGDGDPVPPVVAHSRSPGSWLHRVIGWLQPDLLAELRILPAGDTGGTAGGIPGHDVQVRLSFRTLKARRIVNSATLPPGWTQHRGSSSTTVGRILHPSPSREATATRVASLVDELTAAMGWPLEDWYVVPTS